MKIKINNVVRDMTPEEEAEHITSQTEAQAEIQARIDAKAVTDTNKASGKVKLKAGEALNDAELSALFGD